METVTPEKISLLHSRLASALKPVIVTHMKPDGDAMGSSMGLYHVLKTIYGRDVRVVTADPAPANLGFLTCGECSKDILTYSSDNEGAASAIMGSDFIICMDFNAFHRTDTLQEFLSGSKADKVLIDHHLSPDEESFSLIFSETEVSSASELLFHILMMLPDIQSDAGKLPAETATALMTGMTTDTNNFMNSVYPSTLRMASALLEAGVDRDMILQSIYSSFKESRIRLQGHILKDLMKITSDGVAYIVLDRKDMASYNVEEGDTEGFVNIPLSIDSVRMSVFVKEDTDRLRVSIRSKKGTSANRCARMHFNGGGHENAAGGRLYIPENVSGIGDVAEYIERHTHIFMTEENEQIR